MLMPKKILKAIKKVVTKKKPKKVDIDCTGCNATGLLNPNELCTYCNGSGKA